jgi:tRNA 2-thiouridine synthesizing protein A
MPAKSSIKISERPFVRRKEKTAPSVLDVRGLLCPLPILRLQEAVASLVSGQTLRILSDDPGFGVDLPAWCSDTGNRLLKWRADNGYFEATILVESGSRKRCKRPDPHPR